MGNPGLSLLLAVALVFPATAAAQSVTGTVTDAATGAPLPGVSVSVKGTTIGAASGLDGGYEVMILDTQARLVFSFVGFKSVERDVTVGSEVDVALEEDVLGFDEVVVTGIATSVKRSNLANAVGRVTAEDLTPAPAQTLERALNGKIAGLYISQNTGAPGGGIYVNLRGTSTITGDTQPLYVVDGVILDNSAIQSGIDLVTKATGAGSRNPQGQPSNRIADVNPDDIESLEVLKGPSAAAIYGSKATNGVVIITTKRGRPGKTRINITQQFGVNRILRKMGTRQFTAATAEAATPGGGDLFARNGNIDYEDLLYGNTGLITETSADISGGTEQTRFYASGLALDETGIVRNTGYRKYAGRVNVEHRFSRRLIIATNTSVARTESDRSITGNENLGSTTLGFAQALTPPFLDLRPVNGVYPAGPAGSNPLHTVEVLKNNELTHRVISSGRVSWNIVRRPDMLLDVNVQGGADFYSLQHAVVSPPELQFEQSKDAAVRGISIAGETTSLSTNYALGAVHRWQMSPTVSFNTSAGLQYESRDINTVTVVASGLVATQENIDQASSLEGYQDRLLQRERGLYAQEEIDIGGRVFLTAGLRADRSSRIGDPKRLHIYPKVSASVRLSEYDALKRLLAFADEFKIRMAYGSTGNLPPFGVTYTSLRPENIAGFGGVSAPRRLGNPDIEPEISHEFEFGIDVGFLNERARVELTYYDQNIRDLILENNLPPSSGYARQFINAGDMRTFGVEASVDVTPVLAKHGRWNVRINFGKTASEITRLDVDPFEMGGFALALGQYQIEKGKAPTTIVGLDADGNKTIFGDENPDFNLSWNNIIRLREVTFRFLWDWKQGGRVINLGRFLADIGGTSPDLDEASGQNRLNNPSPASSYIEDGTYLKLREVSLTYDVPGSLLQGWFGTTISRLNVGVSARNLLMFTKYSGFDPEVSQFGNVAIGRSVDTMPFPSVRSIYFKVSVGL